MTLQAISNPYCQAVSGCVHLSVHSTACAIYTTSVLRCNAFSVASHVAYRFICLFVCLSVCVPVYVSVSVWLFLYLSLSLSICASRCYPRSLIVSLMLTLRVWMLCSLKTSPRTETPKLFHVRTTPCRGRSRHVQRVWPSKKGAPQARKCWTAV